MCLIFTLPLCFRIVLMTSIILSLMSPVNVKGNIQETMPSRKLKTGTEERTCLCCPFIIWVEIPGYFPTSTRTNLLNIAQRTHGKEIELENKGYSDGRGFLRTREHTLELAIRLMLSLTCFRSLSMLVVTLIICKATHAYYLYKRWMSIQKVTRLFFKNLQINGGHETPEYRFTSKETEQIPVTPTKPKLLPRHFFELRERFTFFSIKQVLPGYELGRHHTAKGESSDGQKGEYRFEANRINSFRNWPPASPASSLKLARAGLYYSGKGDEVVCFSCGGHLKQWQKGNDPQDKHRRSFPSCRQANGDDPRNVPLYERSFDETLADGMTDLFPNLAREQRSRESTGSSSSSYYGRLASALEASEFGSQVRTKYD
ncbi:uncharacterized protein LOC106170786 [Lingula anatina]|uniref:Uncharacterized protein LOC106170786 n=1 Tax=Lingula anatina TaxID=7574 RepID=A0A2R2MIL6_LINAN|nr:uncharacterized protein LOC106170786 [Lingula anatina]|eukprot:XP_023930071.1 uncharacterized protein LOC106170786 [Lingula anatina]